MAQQVMLQSAHLSDVFWAGLASFSFQRQKLVKVNIVLPLLRRIAMHLRNVFSRSIPEGVGRSLCLLIIIHLSAEMFDASPRPLIAARTHLSSAIIVRHGSTTGTIHGRTAGKRGSGKNSDQHND